MPIRAKRKYYINQFYFPVDGYTHTVDTATSVDGGQTWWYCGMTQYCRSLEEAKAVKAAKEAADKASEELVIDGVTFDTIEKEQIR